ncbi:hypothetical protein QNI19_17855 [Cytophagaceae bacterium DM2B3-1]|uniref:DUF3592 domain-containing protein n=1 Tax=Xanthocytophaga flava TaxID=3048013 RepID=A0ABT7CM33_9BACT|nr:hypothetical protein [Xanthocytophaga flavus]MDJ1494809.1 hypothetical protein [Xanthocytophaga flavus]
MRSDQYLRSEPTGWQKLQAIAFALVIGLFIIRGILWYLDYAYQKNKEEILSNPAYCKGVIVSKRSYKGKGADIDYSVNGEEYTLKTGITTKFYNEHPVGDSVDIIYSKRDPDTAILEYELKK